MKLQSLLLIVVFAFVLFACGEDEEANKSVDCNSFGTDIQEEVQKLLEAAQTYSTEQTSAACNAYLDALDNYLDVVEPYVNKCGDDATFSQWKTAIDQYRATRDQVGATCGS